MKRKINLYYSSVCSIPYLHKIIYFVELNLFRLRFTDRLIASNYDTKTRDNLFILLDNVNTTICLKSPRFGFSLKKFKYCRLICDFTNMHRIDNEYLNYCMWSFVQASSISMKTARTFKNFININQPIFTKIIIPYHEEINVPCNFVIKTLEQLSVLDTASVQCIAYKYPLSLFSPLTARPDFKEFAQNKKNIKIFRPVTLLPYFSQMPWRLRQLNDFIANTSVYIYLYISNTDIIWCFDPEDNRLASFATKNLRCITIYDCVDYFSSINQKINNRICANQAKLIKTVKHFFVNSHILHKIHKHTRPDAVVVAQGFDSNSFLPTALGVMKTDPKIVKIGFVGVINYRIDFELLFKLIERNRNWIFYFTNSQQKNPTEASDKKIEEKINKLKGYNNVWFKEPTTDRQKIQNVIADLDITIIPYDITIPLCRYSYPMKLFEYYYMGKPVIATPIEELKRHSKYVAIASNYIEWEKAVNEIVKFGWPMRNAREQRNIALSNSWEIKVKQIMKTILNRELFNLQ